ncbi:Squalene epoxidase protein [Raphanus sativus]|nr:Squalene epoxidase protein [Raphanus sativus]
MKGINEGAKMKVVATKNMPPILSNKKGVIVLGDAFNMRHPVIVSAIEHHLGDSNKVSEILKSFYNIRKWRLWQVRDDGSARWHEPATTPPHPPTFCHDHILCWLFALSPYFSSSHLAHP